MGCLSFLRNTMAAMSSMCRVIGSGRKRVPRVPLAEARRAFLAVSLWPYQIPSATRCKPSTTRSERRVAASRACVVRSCHAAFSRALWSCSGLPGVFRASRMRVSLSAGLPLASIWRGRGPSWPGDFRSVMP